MKWLNLLERADYNEATDPSLSTLAAIQRQCMLNIPFENLDIHLGKIIKLDGARVYQKIVKNSRGGFCFELNELLLQCLTELDFSCTRVEARVAIPDGVMDTPKAFSHQVSLVQLDDLWLTDIGFGDSSIIPLNLNSSQSQYDGENYYRVTEHSNGMFEILCSDTPAEDSDLWVSLLTVNPRPQPWLAFSEMCTYHQTSPNSFFPKKRLCTKRTENGRITLTGNSLKTRIDGVTTDEFIEESRYTQVLEDLFNIHIDKPEWINPLA